MSFLLPGLYFSNVSVVNLLKSHVYLLAIKYNFVLLYS
jgi:hypothetical protein